MTASQKITPKKSYPKQSHYPVNTTHELLQLDVTLLVNIVKHLILTLEYLA